MGAALGGEGDGWVSSGCGRGCGCCCGCGCEGGLGGDDGVEEDEKGGSLAVAVVGWLGLELGLGREVGDEACCGGGLEEAVDSEVDSRREAEGVDASSGEDTTALSLFLGGSRIAAWAVSAVVVAVDASSAVRCCCCCRSPFAFAPSTFFFSPILISFGTSSPVPSISASTSTPFSLHTSHQVLITSSFVLPPPHSPSPPGPVGHLHARLSLASRFFSSSGASRPPICPFADSSIKLLSAVRASRIPHAGCHVSSW